MIFMDHRNISSDSQVCCCLLDVHLDEFDSLVWQLLMWLLMQVAEWIRSDFSNLVKGQRVWMQLVRC